MTHSFIPLEDLLDASQAHSSFKVAVQDLTKGKHSPLIQFHPALPAVKVRRVISQLLEMEPQLHVRNVKIEAVSGCSTFIGTLEVNDGEHVYQFEWDCRWKAKELGWQDFLGMPDQSRAAREFDYRCFRKWERIK